MTALSSALLLPPAFIDGIGGPELMMIMVLILVLFGGKKLPELARGFGKAMAEIKKATAGVENEIRRAASSVEDEINSAMVPPVAPRIAPPPKQPTPETGPDTPPAASFNQTPVPPKPTPGSDVHPVD